MSVLVIFLLTFVSGSLSKQFSTCELAAELRRQNFPDSQLENWVCLVWAESSARTDAIGGPDRDGSYDFGLFQINDRYWCSNTETPGKACNVLCTDLLKDDISSAAKCAMHIYNKLGFQVWVGWNKECKGKTLNKFKC